MIETPTPGKYQHYKGDFYEVIGTGRHSENPDEQLVAYRALYDHPEYGQNQIWFRPLKMFMETVQWEGKTVLRFKKVD